MSECQFAKQYVAITTAAEFLELLGRDSREDETCKNQLGAQHNDVVICILDLECMLKARKTDVIPALQKKVDNSYAAGIKTPISCSYAAGIETTSYWGFVYAIYLTKYWALHDVIVQIPDLLAAFYNTFGRIREKAGPSPQMVTAGLEYFDNNFAAFDEYYLKGLMKLNDDRFAIFKAAKSVDDLILACCFEFVALSVVNNLKLVNSALFSNNNTPLSYDPIQLCDEIIAEVCGYERWIFAARDAFKRVLGRAKVSLQKTSQFIYSEAFSIATEIAFNKQMQITDARKQLELAETREADAKKHTEECRIFLENVIEGAATAAALAVQLRSRRITTEPVTTDNFYTIAHQLLEKAPSDKTLEAREIISRYQFISNPFSNINLPMH
mgnify:CR=1 FL=1